MLGRFLAYKAMNSVWRSATRRSGLGGASAASPAETAKLALAIMSYAGIFFGGMASCMAGGAVTLSLGLALVWIIGPAVFIAVLNLPDRWVEAKRPLPEGWEETQGRRVAAQMVGVPVVMLLGIGTCFGGQPTLGTIIALGGSCLLFVALVFAPVKWLGYRKVDVTQNGRDKTTAVDAHRHESQLRRNHPRVSSVCSVVSGLGPSIHVRSVCPVCRKESLIVESISGIGWPRLTCECGAPYGTLVKTTFVGETWARYLLSDGQPSRLLRVPGAMRLPIAWHPEKRQDGTRVVDLISGLTPLKWCRDEKDAVLVIVPSEEAAAAILSADPHDYVPVSTPSSPLMAQADYSGFAGRDVIIWPDADKIAVNHDRREPIMRSPNYAMEVGRRLIAAGAARVRVVDVSTVQKMMPPEGYLVEECREFCIRRHSDCAFSVGPCPKDGTSAADIPPAKIAGLLEESVNFEEIHRALVERVATLLLRKPLDGGESGFSDGSAQVRPETAETDSVRVAEDTPRRPHVVYFIRENTGDGKCKVGITTSLERRLRALQTGNPNQLEIVHALEVGDRRTAERIEDAVLDAVRGAGAELQGEWFENAIEPWAWEAAQREYAREP